MAEKDQPNGSGIRRSHSRIIWGASLMAASIIFSLLLIVILVMGRVSVGSAFAWATGAALVTLIIVASTLR